MPSDLDELCRMIGATKRSERKNVQEVINNPKLFSVDGIHLVQKMCDETLDSIAHTRETNSQSAKSRWNKNNNLDDANALPAQSERNANYKLESNNYKKLAGEKMKRKKIQSFAIERFCPTIGKLTRKARTSLTNRYLDHGNASNRPAKPRGCV